MEHFIDVHAITPARWDALYRRFEDIIAHPGDYVTAAQGRVMANLFFEPSTRTSFSFQAAMLRLGGGVFSMSDPSVTSVKKGETLRDTIIMCSGYADALVMRHPREGAAKAASLFASCPVINAGDGGHQHPTQTLCDLTTITRYRGSLQGLNIGLCGDLKYGRTVHSLIETLVRFPNNQFFLISPPELTLPPYLREHLSRLGARVFYVTGLDVTMPQLDVLYMTRIQRERFVDPLEYERHRGVYVLTPANLRLAKKDLIVMHPLPRVDEIHTAVDADPRAVYFEQAKLGMYIRMALLTELLGCKPHADIPAFTSFPAPHEDAPHEDTTLCCPNANCVSAEEPTLPHLFTDVHCAYCETKAEKVSL